MTSITACETDHWDQQVPAAASLLNSLEQGNILLFPQLNVELSQRQQALLQQPILKKASHHIAYDPRNHQLKGHQSHHNELHQLLKDYCDHSKQLVTGLFPQYASSLSLGPTCFIPMNHAQHNDSCVDLHIDALNADPLHGKRLLRVFTNIDPNGEQKTWQIGEPFSQVMQRFAKKIKKPFLLKLLFSRLSVYDHFMLQLNRAMRNDQDYQRSITPQRVDFPAGSSWMAFTDQMSHSSTNNQHTLVQNFYLPISSLQNPQLSPLTLLENYLDHALI